MMVWKSQIFIKKMFERILDYNELMDINRKIRNLTIKGLIQVKFL